MVYIYSFLNQEKSLDTSTESVYENSLISAKLLDTAALHDFSDEAGRFADSSGDFSGDLMCNCIGYFKGDFMVDF